MENTKISITDKAQNPGRRKATLTIDYGSYQKIYEDVDLVEVHESRKVSYLGADNIYSAEGAVVSDYVDLGIRAVYKL